VSGVIDVHEWPVVSERTYQQLRGKFLCRLPTEITFWFQAATVLTAKQVSTFHAFGSQ
jgi:hypothetical protein